MKKIFLFLITILLVNSCNENSSESKIQNTKNETIKIAAFNIQVYGKAKSDKPETMKHIVNIIENYDLVAIQEIRDIDAETYSMKKLMDLLGSEWTYVISRRLGRTKSKEQYAYVYKPDVIEMLDTFTISDPNDYLHREPFCFQGIANDFDFLLAVVHTDPDEAHKEMAYLDDVFLKMLDEEKDLMLIGDFNSSPEEHTDFHIIKNISWIVQDGEFTNVAETKTYDNIIYISDYLTEYDTGGIFNYRQEYNLSGEDTKLISDHYPVWIEIDVSGEDDD